MSIPKVEVLSIEQGATPDPANINKHTQRGRGLHSNSMKKRGVGRSIFSAGKGVAVPVVIGGNQTLEIAAEMGLEIINVHTSGRQIVNVVRDDIAPGSVEAIALGIEDNEIGKLSYSPDIDLLAQMAAGDHALLTTLRKQDDIFNAIVEGMGVKEEIMDTEPQIDRAAELLEKWQVKTGQLWVLGEHKLICGDCTDAAVVGRVMGGELCTLVVTDPPYGVNYADKNTFLNAIGKANNIETPIENDHLSKAKIQVLWKAAFCEMEKVMNKGAVVYCFMPQGGDQMMMMMMMQGAGIEPRHELIWLKNNHVLGRVDYAYKHEPIMYAWKHGGHKFYGDFQTAILEFPRLSISDMHPTMKPVELIERLICNSSMKGEFVYDGFSGSGTSIIACENLHRKCRAVEISPAYCAVALERYLDHTGVMPVLL